MENWYGSLDTKVLDLVSDYAGRELFCLEGDSLILECLDDPALDFEDGFQLLHAVYMVERFLSKLLSAKCNFHIVFFEVNREIPTRAASDDVYRSKYALAREVIFQHLTTHLQGKHLEIQVLQFPAIKSPEFQDHIQTHNVYFVMCHNGALRRSNVPGIQSMLYVIYNVMTSGLDVAIINEIEWKDIKVMTRVIQGRSSKHSDVESDDDEEDEFLGIEQPPCPPQLKQNLQELARSGKDDPNSSITVREALTLAAVSGLVLETPNEKTKHMACKILFHLACVRDLSLNERRLDVQEVSDLDSHETFLDRFCHTATSILRSVEWRDITNVWENDIHDLVDGRVLRSCLSNTAWEEKEADLSSQIDGRCGALLRCYKDIAEFVGLEGNHLSKTKGNETLTSTKTHKSSTSLLPFENKVFDDHLASVHVAVEDADDEIYENAIQDNTHWHNRRRLDLKPPNQQLTKWRNPNRWNQTRFRDMEQYAASLLNTKGNPIERKLIISPELPQKPESKGKNTKSAKAKKIADANEAKKLAKEESSWNASWKNKVKEVENIDPHRQVEEVKSYIEKFDDRKRELLEPEVRLYLLSLLIGKWQERRIAHEIKYRMALAIQVWDQIRILRQRVDRMTMQCYKEFQRVCHKLRVVNMPEQSLDLPSRPLSFPSRADYVKSEQLGAPLDFREFQLLHCGPMMDRQTGAKPDDRVPFQPDKWQRDVLDELDQGHGIFVVAPTSAGKTFISFHAISKVLQEDDTGVLVYVAPTKALVNQIAAEIHARFQKTYPSKSGKTIWAIHTRDIRFNDPVKCQVLVTVPHMLQIMLLSPSNAKTWAPRVKSIIFDEIHSIGQADDGIVWEQLLLLAPCRIIALSATVGNPNEFADWLSVTQKTMGVDLKLIQHDQRYSDLRKYFYIPPEKPNFQGLSRPKHKAILDHELVQGLQPIHPITSILNRQRQMPEDISLEPRDCYLLWKCMLKHESAEFPVPKELHPKNTMPWFIRRSDVFEWEARLKRFLSTWMTNPESPFETVRRDLVSIFSPSAQGSLLEIETLREGSLATSVFPLLVDLHQQNALPALLFHYERTTCEQIVIATLNQLLEAEDVYKCRPAWKKKIADYEKHEALLTKKARAVEKRKPATGKRKPSQDEPVEDPAEFEHHPFDSFYPDRPIEEFTFAGSRGEEYDELEKEIEWMRRYKVKPILLDALKRGIGVHHAGLNRRYRQCVERLFRKGFLRVVVATGTLALGINMPCSTVVFCGDSVYLTALNYRQASGRAGRRGFDLLGNVIFHGIHPSKAYQLISSQLPDLNGHFPITTSLVLRLCILLHNSNNSEHAVRSINALLSQPRLCFGGVEAKDKVLHHLRFSIEYLRRQKLLGHHGQPINLARSVSRLYYTENSAFAFHALLREGYFETVCRSNRRNKETKLRTLMILLAHLFGQKSLGQRWEVLLERKREIKSPSAVVLPNIPTAAATIIHKHNKEILKTYTAYVTTYIEQHLRGPETNLPLTNISVGGSGNPALSHSLGALLANRFRSPFVGLSGHGDKFNSIKELCRTVRSEVFLEESVIPYIDVYSGAGDMAPLNAYLYDFFCHGTLEPLEVANRISRSDSWFLLNDFSRILSTVIVALECYLDPSLEEKEHLMESLGGAGEDSEDEDNGGDEDEDDDDDYTNDYDNGSSKKSATKKGGASKRPTGKANPKASFPSKSKDDGKLMDNWDDGNDNASQAGEDSDSDDSDSDTPMQAQGLVVSKDVLHAFYQLKKHFDRKFYAIFA